MKISPGYIVIINFFAGILAVMVMIAMFVMVNKNMELRDEIRSMQKEISRCRTIKSDCIDQLGIFYRDPIDHLKKKRRIYVPVNK